MPTLTSTATFSRFSALRLQVLYLLQTAGKASKASCKKIGALLDQQYIEMVAVRGLFGNDEIGVEIQISINWREHNLCLEQGGSDILIPDNWSNNISLALESAIETFEQACKEADLRVEWVFRYGKQYNREALNKEYGFQSAKERAWRSTPETFTAKLRPLTEVNMIVSIDREI